MMYPHPYPLHILILNILDILKKKRIILCFLDTTLAMRGIWVSVLGQQYQCFTKTTYDNYILVRI